MAAKSYRLVFYTTYFFVLFLTRFSNNKKEYRPDLAMIFGNTKLRLFIIKLMLKNWDNSENYKTPARYKTPLNRRQYKT
jgi:hypothetical protein